MNGTARLMRRTIGRLCGAALVAVPLALLVGCANIHDNPQARLSDQPVQIDQATQLRPWGPSIAIYANGSVVAPPTLYPYTVKPDLNPWFSPFAEAGIYAGQTIASPVTFFIAKNPQVYSGVITPPTYTAVPPIESVP